jgi:hypothetical protein
MVLPNPYINVLRKIVLHLNDTSIHWALTGSTGMVLQGMPLQVHDIDIQTNKAGAYDIEHTFAEYIIKPVRFVESELICSHLGMLEIDGIIVEVMGDIRHRQDNSTWDVPVMVETYKQWLDMDELHVPVMSLDYEYQAYLRLGRIEKADMIRSWLKK